MRNRLQNAWTIVSNFALGIIGAYAGRNAARRVLRGSDLDVEHNLEDRMFYFAANQRTGEDYCNLLMDDPDFPLWSYRTIRDTWMVMLQNNLFELNQEMERA